jgi:F0F1-type ATP synthase assembly protein I
VAKINASIRKELLKILFWQLMMILGLALLIGLLQGLQRGGSALIGGLAYWVPTLIFLWRVSAHSAARAATRFMIAFFSGEVIKLFLSGVIFLLAVKYLPLDLVYGLVGLLGAIIAFWIASMTSLIKSGGKL